MLLGGIEEQIDNSNKDVGVKKTIAPNTELWLMKLAPSKLLFQSSPFIHFDQTCLFLGHLIKKTFMAFHSIFYIYSRTYPSSSIPLFNT